MADIDPDIQPLVSRAKRIDGPPAWDLIHVERFGLPPVNEKPLLGIRFYFHKPFDARQVHSITFLMDPDGAVEHFLADDSHVDELFAHFAPDTPADETTPNPEETE